MTSRWHRNIQDIRAWVSARTATEIVLWLGIILQISCYLLLVQSPADVLLIYDKLIVVVILVFLVLGLFDWRQFEERTFWGMRVPYTSMSERPLVYIGVTILVVVGIRQWVQMSDIYITFAAIDANPDAGYRYANIVLIEWMLGWGLLLAHTVPWRAWLERICPHWRELTGLAAIVGIAAVLRFRDLGIVPSIINGDEGLIGTWAQGMEQDFGVLIYVFAAIDGVGTNYLYVMSWLFQLIGANSMSLRLFPAIAGCVAIVTNYAFARVVFGRSTAIIVAVLITFAHVHVHFSRQVAVSYIYATALLPLVLLVVWQMSQRPQLWHAVVVSFLLNVHINVYLDGWVWLILVVIVLIVWSMMDPQQMRPVWPTAGWMLGLTMVGLLPMLVWGWHFPTEFFSRLSADGSVVTGWIWQEAAQRNVTPWRIVIEMYQFAMSTFFVRPFEDFYQSQVPTLDALTAVVFAVGLVLVHNLMHTRRMLLLLGWFWGGVTALAVMTIPLSTYHYRLLVVLPVVYLIVAYVYVWVIELVSATSSRRGAWTIIGMVLVVFAMQNMRIYQEQLVSVCRYGDDLRTRQAGLLGNYLFEGDIRHHAVVVFGDPNMFYYGPWKSIDFLAPDNDYYNVEELNDLDALRTSPEPHVYVAIPERLAELEWVATTYAAQATSWQVITDCGTPALYVFTVSRLSQ